MAAWRWSHKIFTLQFSHAEFSDVQFYKAICLARLGKKEESKTLFEKAKKDAETGYTINEDNAIYETYPYKVRW